MLVISVTPNTQLGGSGADPALTPGEGLFHLGTLFFLFRSPALSSETLPFSRESIQETRKMATGLLKAKKEVRIFITFHVGCQQDESNPFPCTAACLAGIEQRSRLFLEEWWFISHGGPPPPFNIPLCSTHTSVILKVVSCKQHTWNN